MRIVVALGGNALLRRGEPMTAENQRGNVRIAAGRSRPSRCEHELVIAHGNGPQVGLLALQGAAYQEVETYPLDVLGRADRGHDRLHDRAGARQPAAVRAPARDAADHDRGRCRRPGLQRPDQVHRPGLRRERTRTRSPREKGWTFKQDGDKWRRVVPSPMPRRIFELGPIQWLLERDAS